MATIKNTQAKITVDMFYERQKELYDICGNEINKDKFPFVDILSKYLTDVVGLIDIEIKNSARNSMINWREKKNPKLLSRLINSDENVNLINMSMNKITSSNYMNIVNEISEALLNDNYRKLPDYCSFLFDVVIKKCMIDEAFAKDYIRFLFGFKDGIAKHLSENINKFTAEALGFLTGNQGLKEYGYFHYVKDVALWRNVGVIFANIYKSISNARIGVGTGVNRVNMIESLEMQFDVLFNILDWLPANMDELNGRLYMVFAIMEILIDDIWLGFSDKYRALFNEILTLVYNCANIPNKIKFKVLDLQDMIKNIKVSVAPSTGTNTSNTGSISVAAISTSSFIVEKPIVSEEIKVEKAVSLSDNQVNIWEARKQQQQIVPVQNQSTIPMPKYSTESAYNLKVNNRPRREDNMQVGTESFRNRNRNKDRKSSQEKGVISNYNNYNSNGNRNNGKNNGKSNIININRTVESEPKSRNMFSGLESSDSNDEHSNEPLDKNKQIDEEDDFITVEKKTKNIYKPKKTPALAIEGGKIYSKRK